MRLFRNDEPEGLAEDANNRRCATRYHADNPRPAFSLSLPMEHAGKFREKKFNSSAAANPKKD
jgi:hypothetical protein